MSHQPNDPTPAEAVTTPAGVTTSCPQCGVTLDGLATACGRCGAVITGGGLEGERAERIRQRLQSQIGGAYELGALIGRGGMGIVFRAREVALDREVALKVLAFDPVLNPDAFARFEREAKLAARLDHPHIVPIFAVGQGDGVAFYTMRYVRGGSLESLVAAQGALGLDEAVRLLREVAEALDVAHAQGIVHRDIKPANILLSESGHAMVADFGIARAFTGDNATSTSGSATGVVGSPAYMAPEQWRGERPDGRTDQYALGVLAFELLTGQRPFRDPSMQELLRRHLGDAPPTIESVRKGLPPRVSQAVSRALSKDPADRFASATAFVAALAGEAAVGAGRRAPAAAAATRGARPRQWLGNALAAVMVLTAATVGFKEWRRAQRSAVPPAVPAPVAPAADTLAERLARELEETRKIALDAQRRAERAETMQREQPKQQAAPAMGHVAVVVRGGSPRLLIDNMESAASTPAILDVPAGRHVIRVEEAGRQYQPAQYEIDVSPGDTSKLAFYDPRAGGRDMTQSPQQLNQFKQQNPSVRFGPPRPGAAATQSAGPALDAAGATGDAASTGAIPFNLPPRVWQMTPAQEREMLLKRWNRMSSDQQRRAVNELQSRDSTSTRFPRRGPQRPLPPQ